MVSLLEKILSFNKPKNINVFLCGLRGSGKTTLLYKSLIKDLGAVVNELEPTTLYHYEELRVGRKQFGIWDFSGDVTVRDVPGYVARQVQVTAVVFVVSAVEHSESSCKEIINRIRTMDLDDAFAHSLFVILFNQISCDSQCPGLETLLKKRFADPHRFVFISANVLHGIQDTGWSRCLDVINDHHKKVTA